MPGNDANTRLLMHFDRLPGGWAYDESVGGRPKDITLTGAISWAQSRFGNGSLWCDGSGGHLSIAGPMPDWLFGAADFTVDFWGWIDNPSKPYLCAWWYDANNLLALEPVRVQGGAVEWRFRYRAGGHTIVEASSPTNELIDVVGAWHHYALVRAGIDVYVFVDGTLYASGTLPSASRTMYANWFTLYLGRSTSMTSGALASLQGWVDEFRVQMGAVWVADFSPPDRAYHPVSELVCRGGHNRRRATTVLAVGHHDRGVKKHRVVGRGSHTRLRRCRVVAGGSHSRRRPATITAYGTYGRSLRRFTVVARGRHSRRRSVRLELRGTYRILDTTFGVAAHGTHRRYRRAVVRARGDHRRLRRFRVVARGSYSIETAGPTYELFHGLDATPDFQAPPFETFSGLPHTTAAITGEGVHHFVLRRRNRYGLSSANIATWRVELDANDNEIALRPSRVIGVGVTPAVAGAVRVSACYPYNIDAGLQADEWLVYLTTGGADPDPAVDAPTHSESMGKADGVAVLDWTSPAYGDGTTIKVRVAACRSADGRDGDASGVVETTASDAGPPPAGSLRAFQRVKGDLVQLA